MSDVKFIELGNGKRAVIDAKDYDLVRGYSWRWLDTSRNHKHGTGYVQASYTVERGTCATVMLHRLILGAEKGQVVEFADKNGLNCTRENLKVSSRAAVNRKTQLRDDSKTGIRNVQVDKERGGFIACVRFEGVRHKQRFSNLEEADAWARQKRLELFGAP